MQNAAATLIGKIVRSVLFFRGGGGHALPGLVVERLFPNYVSSMLAKLPEGVVIITGTNGKTTTTKMVTALLAACGKRVLTNPTGSNLVRGIASSISKSAGLSGRLAYDIAILEIDEATARKLVSQIRPRWVLGLNVSRDQLDRFGEVDTVAKYVGAAMEVATEGIVTNAKDPHLSAIAEQLRKEGEIEVVYFGSADRLDEFFPDDYELASIDKTTKKKPKISTEVELYGFDKKSATYEIAGQKYNTTLKISGQHNYLNGAAALALCRRLLPQVEPAQLIEELSKVTLAFGRGEEYKLAGGANIELVLVKNPASFTQALSSYGAKKQRLMIAINDNIADGRDVSWLWDVNFSPLKGRDVEITSGSRAADMALRLSYDDIATKAIEPGLVKAVKKLASMDGEKVVLATYTAMLQLHAYLTRNEQNL